MRLFLGLFLGLAVLPAASWASPISEAKTEQAISSLEKGDTAAARALLEEAVALDAADPEARHHLGRVFLQLGDPKQAVAHLKAAQAAGYPNPLALGVALYQMGQYDAAGKALSAAIAYQEKQLEAHYYQGLVHLRQERFEPAAASFATARADDALRNRAVYYQAVALHRLGRNSDALPLLAEVAELDAGQVGDDARALRNRLAPAKAWRVRADLLQQFDSNVILAQTDRGVAEGMYGADAVSNQAGSRMSLLLGGDYRFQLAKTTRLSVAYTGYQSYHQTNRDLLQRYDVSAHTLGLRAEHQRAAWLGSLALTGNASILGPIAGAREYRGETPAARGYSRSFGAAPLVLRSFGKNHGAGLGYTFGLERFANEGAPVSLAGRTLTTNRSNAAHELSALYLFRFAEQGHVTPSLGVFMSDARGENNLWDHQGAKAQVRAALPLFAGLSASALATATLRTFATPYPQAGNAAVRFEDRRDRELSGGLNLAYQFKGVRAQAGGYVQRNASSVAAYDYSRFVTTVGLGADL